MPVHERHLVSFDEVLFGLVFTNRLLFGMFFRKEDLTISPNRKDLPPEWHGKQVISTQQRLIKCDVSNKIAMRLGRKTDKTGTMEDEFFQRALNYTGTKIIEGLFFTPGEAHMIPWQERLKLRISKVPLFDMMVSNFNTGKGVVNFRNGVTCYTRIEGTSGTGRNMVGLRCGYIIGDEADYGNDQSHIERKQTALPDCTWMLGGVPRGIRDLNPFYRICTDPVEGRDWSIHKYPSFINPIYASEEARDQLKNDYGGELTLGYVTQVLAQDGDAVSSSFPMIPIKMDLSHQIFELTENDVINAADWDDILPVRPLPQGVSACVVGMDVGYSPDPSELGIFYRLGGIWHMHARITLRKVMYPVQARIVKWLHDKIGFHRIGIDNVGVGMGLYQHVQILLPDTLVGGQAGSKQDIPIMVHKVCKTILQRREGDWWCAECQRFITREDDTEPASIQRKVYLTEHLKQAFHLGQQYVEQVGMYRDGQIPENEIAMVVPFDRQLEDELAGTSETKSRSGTVSYISPPSTGDHRTDMLRYAMGAILALNDQEINENVIRDAVNAGGGWANVRPMGSSVSAWRPPWQMS